jgi:hypothetical protein
MKIFDNYSLGSFLMKIKSMTKSKKIRSLISNALTDLSEMEANMKEEYAENEDIFLGDVFEDVIRDKLGLDYSEDETEEAEESENKEVSQFIESIESKYGSINEQQKNQIKGFIQEFNSFPNALWLENYCLKIKT